MSVKLRSVVGWDTWQQQQALYFKVEGFIHSLSFLFIIVLIKKLRWQSAPEHKDLLIKYFGAKICQKSSKVVNEFKWNHRNWSMLFFRKLRSHIQLQKSLLPSITRKKKVENTYFTLHFHNMILLQWQRTCNGKTSFFFSIAAFH